MEQQGTVLCKPFAVGSKSEHQAIVLQTADREYVLRILGGNPFQDDRLRKLVGKRIRVNGKLHGYTFLMEQWAEE